MPFSFLKGKTTLDNLSLKIAFCIYVYPKQGSVIFLISITYTIAGTFKESLLVNTEGKKNPLN